MPQRKYSNDRLQSQYTRTVAWGEKQAAVSTMPFVTITADELGDGYCPECFESQGEKRYEFEELEGEGKKNGQVSM